MIYDSVGRTTFDKGLNCLVPRGTMVLFGQSSGPIEPFDPQVLAQKGSLFLTRPSLVHYTATRAELIERAGRCWAGWGRRAEVRIEHEFPLEGGRQRTPGARGTPHDRQGAAPHMSGPPPGETEPLPGLVSTDWLAQRLGRPGSACSMHPGISPQPVATPPPNTAPPTSRAPSTSISTPSAITGRRCPTCCQSPPRSHERCPRWASTTAMISSCTTAPARTSAPRERGGPSECSGIARVAVLDGGLAKWRA